MPWCYEICSGTQWLTWREFVLQITTLFVRMPVVLQTSCPSRKELISCASTKYSNVHSDNMLVVLFL
uniref:Uncharacterized protein n=1 Tax=Setaria viridis TaxID=4556 RepID=A0A4U6VU41_SETVI|nr:hypothetical protein SEVIR_3G307200v2 [Setaria viridis]